MEIKRLLDKHWELSQGSLNTKLRVRSDVLDYSNAIRVRSMSKMTTDSVLLWGARKLSDGRRTSTVSTCYNSIRAFVAFAKQQGVEVSVDSSRVRCTPHYRERRALTPRQIKRILSFADPQTALLIRLAYMCGLRRSEALSITVEMVRYANGGILYVTGKGNKTRPVFLTPELQEDLMFVQETGRCFPITADYAYEKVKHAMIDAGYEWANFHTLRHSFATVLISQGADISQVSRLLGHSSISTTMIYVHMQTTDIQKTHKRYIIPV